MDLFACHLEVVVGSAISLLQMDFAGSNLQENAVECELTLHVLKVDYYENSLSFALFDAKACKACCMTGFNEYLIPGRE